MTPAVDRMRKHYEDAANELRDDVTTTINGWTGLGALAETSSYYTVSVMARVHSALGLETPPNKAGKVAARIIWMVIGEAPAEDNLRRKCANDNTTAIVKAFPAGSLYGLNN
jgi:hypothetical protein